MDNIESSKSIIINDANNNKANDHKKNGNFFTVDNAKDVNVTINFSVWKYLMNMTTQPDRKLTKVEAFFDLIVRQRINILVDNREYSVDNFNVLCKDWNWSLTRVKRFIHELTALGAVNILRQGRDNIISLNNVTLPPQTMPDSNARIADKNISAEQPNLFGNDNDG